MKLINWILFAFSLSVIASCKTVFPSTKKARREAAAWKAVVSSQASDSAIKNYWLELIEDRWAYFKNFNSSLTQQDLPNLKFIPNLVYEIDSSHFFNYDGRKPISSILSLNKTEVLLFVTKKDSAVAAIYPELREGNWQNGGGYGVPSPGMAQKVMSLKKAGQEVYEITVVAFPAEQRYFRKYWVTYTGKEFMIIEQDGSLRPLDRDLVRLKSSAQRVVEEMKRKK